MLKLMEGKELGLKPEFGESEFPKLFMRSQLGRQKHLHYVIVFLVSEGLLG